MDTQLSFEQKYEAVGNPSGEFEGLFITAVKTTGIFCRPSCRARKPKQENAPKDTSISVEIISEPKRAYLMGVTPIKNWLGKA